MIFAARDPVARGSSNIQEKANPIYVDLTAYVDVRDITSQTPVAGHRHAARATHR
jgi:hypothetical protein